MSLALNVTPLAPTCSEHDLVAAVRRGDERAFEELYSRYRRRIGAYVFGMVADHGRAEDITQEVFISALRRIRDSERPIAFKPWIYEIAKNACIDDFRRTRRAREVPVGGDEELEEGNPRLHCAAITPEVAVENRQQLTDLRGAFRGLSESHHKIIVLRELEGMSYTQIGEQMGMSRPVVESTLFRARRRLGEEYDELVSGRRCDRVQAVIGDRGPRAIRSLGIKERRLVARHLSHCQPCRRQAHLIGFDESALQMPAIGKIAALLPIPAWLRLRRGAGSGAGKAAVASKAHGLSALQSVQTVASRVDPSSPFAGMGRVAAAAAALVVAGAGGGIVTGLSSTSTPHHRASVAGAGGAHARLGGAGRAARSTALAAGGAVYGVAARQGPPRGAARPGALSASSASGAGVRTGGAFTSTSGRSPATIQSHGPGSAGPFGPMPAASGASAGSGGKAGSSGGGLQLTGAPKISLPGQVALPTLPHPGLPSVSLPSLPLNSTVRLPPIPLPGPLNGTSGPVRQGLQQGLPIPLSNPTAPVAPVLHKLGVG
jgi:RNA polymerase sigma factor (sigma-70 family)